MSRFYWKPSRKTIQNVTSVENGQMPTVSSTAVQSAARIVSAVGNDLAFPNRPRKAVVEVYVPRPVYLTNKTLNQYTSLRIRIALEGLGSGGARRRRVRTRWAPGPRWRWHRTPRSGSRGSWAAAWAAACGRSSCRCVGTLRAHSG